MLTKLLCLVCLGGWLLLGSPAAWAQSNVVAPELPRVYPSQSGLSASDISAEKVNHFVRAYQQVLDLLEQRETDLQGAPTQLEAQQVQREIEQEALALIEATGLTRQEYLQLLSLANVDRDFGERIAAQLQEAP